MRTVVVVCADKTRRGYLARVVREYAPKLPIVVAKCATAKRAANSISIVRRSVCFVVFSLVGGGLPKSDMRTLKKCFPKAKIIVELDGDDVEKAFEMLRLGAFNVVSRLITKAEKLWEIFARAVANAPRADALVRVKSRKRHWGFMSMSFDPGSIAYNDYYFAIYPTMKCLQLDLRPINFIPYDGDPRLTKRIESAIAECPVFVILISCPTQSTQYELGFASALKKKVVFLRRADGEPIPTLQKDRFYIGYSTLTELAMKLFFGLGGTPAILKKYSAKAVYS